MTHIMLILDKPACGPTIDGRMRRPSQEHTCAPDTCSAGNGGRALEALSSTPRNRRGSGTVAVAPILRA